MTNKSLYSQLMFTNLDLTSAKQLVPQMPETSMFSASERAAKFAEAKALLEQRSAVMITHYYADDVLQELTEITGGLIGDSLEMARFGRDHKANTLIVSGVHFMGETAKILSPDKRILVPDLGATCSMDIGCPSEEFAKFCAQYPDHEVVVYVNSSAAVKALADWGVTSSMAVPLIEHLHAQGKKILWAPDKHLGHYLQRRTGAEMVMWDGACIVHEAFKANALRQLKQQYPDAYVLVHPEAPAAVLELADFIGSTSQMLKKSAQIDNPICIVGTERGIFYKMRQASPHKQFIQAPAGGHGATCQSCAHCPWMKLNSLDKLISVLESGTNTIELSPEMIERAQLPLQRMLTFAQQQGLIAAK
jgi:quinolinate synthase